MPIYCYDRRIKRRVTMDYQFIGIDEGKQNLLKGSTTGKMDWIVDLADYPTARAMQRISETEVLIGYSKGYFTVDIDSKAATLVA